MNKPIIINGCNVAECPFYQYQSADDYNMKYPESGDCEIGMAGYLYEYDRIREELEKECISNSNCFYKQLQRLQEENERLKQALEEVRECINVLSTADKVFKGSMVEWKINKIINEVLKSE